MCESTVAVKRERSLTGHCLEEKALPHFCVFLGVGLESECLYCVVFSSQCGRGAMGSTDLIQYCGMTNAGDPTHLKVFPYPSLHTPEVSQVQICYIHSHD